jgi:hypothetical protein
MGGTDSRMSPNAGSVTSGVEASASVMTSWLERAVIAQSV